MFELVRRDVVWGNPQVSRCGLKRRELKFDPTTTMDDDGLNGENQRGRGINDGRRLMDDGKRGKDHYLLAFQKCIAGSAYTYKVQEGHNGIGIRKEGTIRNDYRYVYSKSSIHSK
jgi:hypothetical protein